MCYLQNDTSTLECVKITFFNGLQNASTEVSSFGGGGNFGVSTTNFDGDFSDRKESLSSQVKHYHPSNAL